MEAWFIRLCEKQTSHVAWNKIIISEGLWTAASSLYLWMMNSLDCCAVQQFFFYSEGNLQSQYCACNLTFTCKVGVQRENTVLWKWSAKQLLDYIPHCNVVNGKGLLHNANLVKKIVQITAVRENMVSCFLFRCHSFNLQFNYWIQLKAVNSAKESNRKSVYLVMHGDLSFCMSDILKASILYSIVIKRTTFFNPMYWVCPDVGVDVCLNRM